ncbi:glycosyltransferase family 1 protein [Patescibacteria group bacterium]|nr:MAG: glycosyltransferase family 1 protein [Patescibacteria group bacterium]
MSHIVIDARIINSSTGRYVERLLHYLQTIDTVNKYTVLVLEKDKNYWMPTADNFSTIVADFDQYSIAEQTGFKRFIDDLAPDLVHFTMPQQPIRYKGNKVTTIHDLTLLKVYNSDKNWLVYHFKQLVGHFVFKRVIATSSQILTPSDYSKDEIIEFDRRAEGKITTTYLAADLSKDEPEPYELPFKRFLLYVGQQSDYKNIPRLASAHQRLIKKYPDLGLVLVGSKNASVEMNEELFTDRNYKNIVFTGYLPDPQLNWLYKEADAYVFPSLMEGFGLPGLEAMGHGTPVVSSSATCLPEIYGDAAHYFNPNDTTDMARAIDEVLDNHILRTELVKVGHAQFKKYSWHDTAKQTHQIYLDALEKEA